MRDSGLPGLGACALARGQVVWCEGFGVADFEADEPVTPDTAFLVASVSKTVTAAAAMQLVESGRLALDTDVADVLGLPVAHPRSASPITVRHLLTHTSGVVDNWDAMADFYVDRGPPRHTLAEAVLGYLRPGGRWYDAAANFADPPGSSAVYSNMGIALLGYVVEVAAGRDFGDYCAEHIFAPLEMRRTSFHIDDLAGVPLAMPYAHVGSGFEPYGHYGFADYPNGGLRSSASDMARFVAAHLDAGGSILRADTVAEMVRDRHTPGADGPSGLVWALRDDGGAWHDGGEDGVLAEIGFHPGDGSGYVLLANGDGADAGGLDAIRGEVRRLARRVAAGSR